MTRLLPAAAVPVLLLAAACSPTTTTAAAAPTTTASAPTTTAAAPTTEAQAPTPRCTTPDLTASLTPTEGAAGSVYTTILLTNRSDRACELVGYPGVSYVTGDDEHQVGPAAERTGPRAPQVTLAPGGAAGAQLRMVQVRNFDEAVCRPVATRGLRVYPPGDTRSLVIPVDGTGCSATPPGPQLSVESVKPA